MKQQEFPTGRDFDTFISDERRKNIFIVKSRYSLSDDEAEDIVSDAICDLYESKMSGRLARTVVSVASYLTKICLNKCFHHKQRHHEAASCSIDADELARTEIDRINDFLASSAEISDEAMLTMRRIVADLPSPCDKVLWGYYEDGLSMAEIAKLVGLKDASSAKSTKSNCISKLKARYNNTLRNIRYGEL